MGTGILANILISKVRESMWKTKGPELLKKNHIYCLHRSAKEVGAAFISVWIPACAGMMRIIIQSWSQSLTIKYVIRIVEDSSKFNWFNLYMTLN